jgi:hypothetical protein
MGGLPLPELPPGPHRDLVGALHDLHHRAGWPSLRTLAKAAGCSHTTVSTVFSSPRLPTWGVLELLVEAMDGQVAEFRTLWLAATEDQPGAPAPPGLAGRRVELNAVLSQLDGSSGLLLVAGEAGIGKTRLVSTAARLTTGTFIASVNCLPLANALPMLPVTEALQTLAAEHDGEWMREALASVPTYVPAALSHLLPQVGAGGDRVDERDEWARPRLFLAVGTTMQALRAVRSWAFVIEDLHWADTDTLDLLEHVVSHGAGVPMVGTWRLDDPDTPALAMEWWTRVRRSHSVRVLELGPLTRDETAAQLELLAGARCADVDVDRIHRRSQGLPLFTEQLAAHANPSAPLPRLLTDLLDQRLGDLSAAGWRVAAVLGAADRPLDSATLENACGLEPEALGVAVRELADRQLLATDADARLGLRHPLLAEAARRRLLGPEKSHVHRRLARALADAGDSAAEIAEHWQLAGNPAEELHWRIAAALDAAARFAKRMEWVQWRRAFALWTDETSRFGPPPGVTLTEALIHGYDAADYGDLGGEKGLHERLLAMANAPTTPRVLRAEALRRCGDYLVFTREAERGLGLLGEAADIYRDLPPDSGYVETLEDQARALSALGQPRAGLATIREAVAVAEGLPNRQHWRHVVAMLAWHEGVLGDHAQARALTAQVLDGQDPNADPFHELSIGTTLTDLLLIQHALPEEFERAGGPGLETAERWNLGYATAAPILRTNMALGYLAAGLVGRAVAALGQVPDEVTIVDMHRQYAQGCLDVASGRLEAAARRFDRLPPFPDPLSILDVAAAGARLEVWRGQPARACARLGAALAVVLGSELAVRCGTHLLLLARATADRATSEGHGLGTRSGAAADLRNLSRQAPIDPFGAQLTPEARTALGSTWKAELARITGVDTTETWSAAASAWDPMVRPHDAAYCRWRAAQVALEIGQGTLAARLLRRADRDAREHVPLTNAIARTAAYAPGRERT